MTEQTNIESKPLTQSELIYMYNALLAKYQTLETELLVCQAHYKTLIDENKESKEKNASTEPKTVEAEQE